MLMFKYISECRTCTEKHRSDLVNTALYLKHLTEEMLTNKRGPHVLVKSNALTALPCHYLGVTDYSPVSYSLDFHCKSKKG